MPVTRNYVELKEGQKLGKFYAALEGSSGSGKTYGVCQYLIEQALTEKQIITAFRDDQTTCKDSIVADFQYVMIEQFQLWDATCWNSQRMEYRFPNGSLFQFRGANSPAKLHGPRRQKAWLNEVMEISYEAYRQIAIRTSDQIIMDWNPSMNTHWVFDKILSRKDVHYIHSTYLDNPMLPDNAVREIEALEPTKENLERGTADEWAWTVYGLGKRGRKEGAIFKLWDLCDDFPPPMACQRYGYGLDYGFSQDPTALIECALFQDMLYLREHVYERELIAQSNEMEPNIPSIEGRLRQVGIAPHARIHAESARPEINRALQMSGFKIVPTKKGPDSILAGIDRLRSVPIIVDRSSHHLQMELESYSWARDSRGNWLDHPEDKNNHLIDAARYWALAELEPMRKPGRARARARIAQSSLKQWR